MRFHKYWSDNMDSEKFTDSVILTADHRADNDNIPKAAPRKHEIIYPYVLIVIYIHAAALYGLFLCFTSAKTGTVVFNYILYVIGGYGVSAGAHRLWTHRSYKAKPVLEFITMLCNCIAFQKTVITWVKVHRLHHTYSDTDADPHNARRGFFYSHIGWLLVKKSDIVTEQEKNIDISDVENNPILQFQKKYAIPLFITACFAAPTVIPIIYFNEEVSIAWHASIFRYAVALNTTFLVNSIAHTYGSKPYDKNILPSQNLLVSFLAGGEGFHNYHHIYPWDYRTAEIENNYLNSTTLILDLFAWMGWVYDLKTAKPETVEKKAHATGDGTNSWGFKR